MLDLLLLGPVTLRKAGLVVPLPTQKAQALLLLLALGGRQPRARLAAWLWPQVDDGAARRNLRRELARLREAGLGEALLSEGEQLALGPTVSVDAQCAEAAAAAGATADAIKLWRGALADGLDIGPADDFADWLAGQRQRLHARWRQWLASAAEACEARGDPSTALSHLATLLDDDPLQEHYHRQVMRLQAAAGQREAALAQYQRCRALLHCELGLAPSADTEALAQQLRGAAGGISPTPMPTLMLASTLPAAGVDWPAELPRVGRDTEWAQLQAAWAAGRTIVIEGDAGIGKTRLARDFAASQGAYALAQCRRSDTGVPYASFTRVLRRLAGDSLAQTDMPPWVRLELAHVLPELGSAPPQMGSAQEQRRFCEACAAAWQGLSAGSFDTVVMDDWHLADDASRSLMGFIADQRPGRASDLAREIFVQRPAQGLAPAAPLSAPFDAASVLHLRLAPLGSQSVYRLVQQLSGAADPRRFAQRLESATGGNPFFLGETLRHWLALRLLTAGPAGVWQTPFDDATQDYAELPVPDTVRDAVLARVHSQSEAVRHLLEAAALANEPFTPALLVGACAMSEVAVLDAIERAVAAQLLREREGGYAFEHDLVQTALENALVPERRRLVHCRLALGAEAAGLPVVVIARHWEAGGQPERAVPHRIAAAERALVLYADADAQAHWAAALSNRPTLAEKVRILGQRWQLHVHRGDLPALLTAVEDLDAARHQAMAQATPAGARLALDAAVHAAEILAQCQRTDEALQRIQACLGNVDLGVVARAQALRVQSLVLSRLGRTSEARAATEAALTAGGLSALQQGDLLHALSYTHFLRGDADASLDHARRALAIWQSAGARRPATQAQASIGRALDMLDQREVAWAALQTAYSQAAELGMIDLQRVVANNLANNRLHHGGPARAIEVIREAVALSPHFTMAAMPVFYLGIQAQAQAQLGELGAALDLAEQALQQALALGEHLTVADCIGMTLDLHSQLGNQAACQRLLLTLADRPLDGLRYFEIKLGLVLAAHEVRYHQLGQARVRLQVVGDVDLLPQPPDRAAARLRHAQLALAEGDAQRALGWLAPLGSQVLYTEVQAQSCAARLAAHGLLGQRDEAALALADQALAAPAAGRVLPALAWLGLRQARHQAALQCGDAATAARLLGEIQAQQHQLAASLHGHAAWVPALQDQAPTLPRA